MQNNKSYAEFVLGTYASLLKDCEVRYPALTKEFKRDYTRLSSAIEHHGIRFALDVMPAWRKHFDKCLASGRLTRSGLPHFSCWKTEGTVPRLFRGLVLRVFDIKGDLKPEPDVQAIKLIRQLLGVFRKLRMDCGPKSRSDAVKDFIMTDLEVAVGNLNWDADEDFDAESAEKLSFIDSSMDGQASKSCSIQDFKVSDLPYELARSIQQVADYFTASLGEYDPAESRFRHGPGAVSDQRLDRISTISNPGQKGLRRFSLLQILLAQILLRGKSPLYISSVTSNSKGSCLPAWLLSLKRLKLLGLLPVSLLRFSGVSSRFVSFYIGVCLGLLLGLLSIFNDKNSTATLHSRPPMMERIAQLTCQALLIGCPAGTSNVSSDVHRASYDPCGQHAHERSSRTSADILRNCTSYGNIRPWVTLPLFPSKACSSSQSPLVPYFMFGANECLIG